MASRNTSAFRRSSRVHLLQSGVLDFQLLHPRHQSRIHAAVLGPPFIETGAVHAVFAAQFRYRCAGVGLLQKRDDLAICES